MADSVDKQTLNKPEVAKGKGHKWKKGQSGNPAGRPKKELCLTQLVKEYLESQAKNDKGDLLFNPDGTPKTYSQMLAMAMVHQASKGNPKAIEQVWDRIDGKVATKLEHGGMDGNPNIQVQIKDKRKQLQAIFENPELAAAAEKLSDALYDPETD